MIWLLLLLGCAPVEQQPDPSPAPAPAQAEPVVEEAAPTGHSLDVARYVKLLELADAKIEVSKPAHTAWAERSGLLFALARLKGTQAEARDGHAAAERAWKGAPTLIAVKSAWAQALQRSHRFAEAAEVLDGLKAPSDQALAATVAFELGDYEVGVTKLRSLLEANPRDPGIASRLAVCEWKLGQFEKAEASMALAQKHFHGRERWVKSWQHLMLGLMDLEREKLDDALAHYQDADEAMSGWWLVQEHIAEIHLLQGRPEVALPIYEAVVEETGSPEIMAARADALDALGRKDEATKWRDQARATFEEHVKANPAAAGGHALEFFLEHGTPERAHELAVANVKLRPNGEAKLMLADAKEGIGNLAEAERLRAEVRESGWWMGPE